MSRAWLVAARELSVRVRERSTIVSTVLSIVIVVGIAVLVAVLDDDGPDTSTVAVVGSASAAVGAEARRLAPIDDRTLELRRATDVAGAEALLRGGDVDAAVIDGERLLFAEDVDDGLAGLLQEASARTRAAEALRADGVDPTRIRQALDPPPLAVDTVDDGAEDGQEGVAFVVVLILFGQLITYGMAVATGVVEEKTSRIVEVLLATIRPWQLLWGKIVGIGLLGLGQVLLVTVAGAAAAIATGIVDATGDVLTAVAVAVGWYLLGYLLYACLFAVTGAIVPRQEELQSAAAPLTLAITIAYFVGFAALQSPDGIVAQIGAYVPLSSPLVMPPLIIAGDVGALEIAASLAILVASIAVLVPLAARLYAGSVLQLRTRVSLAQAWRAAAEERSPAAR